VLPGEGNQLRRLRIANDKNNAHIPVTPITENTLKTPTGKQTHQNIASVRPTNDNESVRNA